jgi:hypothetical protein
VKKNVFVARKTLEQGSEYGNMNRWKLADTSTTDITLKQDCKIGVFNFYSLTQNNANTLSMCNINT